MQTIVCICPSSALILSPPESRSPVSLQMERQQRVSGRLWVANTQEEERQSRGVFRFDGTELAVYLDRTK